MKRISYLHNHTHSGHRHKLSALQDTINKIYIQLIEVGIPSAIRGAVLPASPAAVTRPGVLGGRFPRKPRIGSFVQRIGWGDLLEPTTEDVLGC